MLRLQKSCKFDEKVPFFTEFDLLGDRVTYKVIYKNLGIEEFELRGENKSPLYLRLDIERNADSYSGS